MMALIALGRVRARRGDPGVWEALDEAGALAGQSGTLQRVAPMLAARTEALWLGGRAGEAAAALDDGFALAMRKRHAWFAAELLYWRRRARESPTEDVPDFCAGNPFALEATGRSREAGAAWHELGCPYEQARALSQGDESQKREALEILESLGAVPLAERVRHELRASGVRGLKRGPRDSTRRHPAGLTGKEVDVLVLLCEGLRNKDIAQRLHRSVRTVDHHVAAILEKLGATNRAEAVVAAHRLGLVTEAGTVPSRGRTP
jgi:DNA-binding CsgD family transcriptional regulator